ncbi:MAG: ABC transporter permease [Algicola sp.]|nr:ABC transporter permease [Algicola sp.]
MHVIYDILYAMRLLKKTPRFTALTICVLAGGLAISLFTFAFLYTFTSKPLPLPEQGTLYRASLFWHSDAFGERRHIEAYEAAKIRENVTTFAEHGVWQNKTVSVSLGDNKLVTAAVRTTPNLFKISRTQPLMGRTLELSDSDKGSAPVGMISFAIWQGQFAGDQDVVGKSLYVNGISTEIVGVMPQGYRFPISHDLWLPIAHRLLDPLMTDREKVNFFGRLAPGVSVEQAQTQFYNLAKQAFDERSELMPGVELIRGDIGLFQAFDISASMKILVFVLNLVAFFILFLAAINVGNLLFARAIQRSKESAIRTALGAPHWRLVSQLMWEGVIITISGTVLALIVVGWLLSLINVYFHMLMNNELAFWYQWELDSSVLLAGLGFALFTIFVACFLPAVKAARQDFNMVLRDGTRGAQSRSIGRISRFLVTTQIAAISIIMVLGTVISVKVNQATDLKLGYDYKKLYFSIVELPHHNYPNDDSKALFFDKLQKQLTQNEAFSDVSVRFSFRKQPVAIDGVEYQKEGDKPRLSVYSLVGNSDFMGPTLVAGRHLDERDNVNSARTVLISESMSKRHWQDGSPLGKRLDVNLNGSSEKVTIVGVVSDTSNNPFEKPVLYDEIYLSGYQYPTTRGTVFFRRVVETGTAEDEFFRTMGRIDSQLDILTIEDWELETSATSKMVVTFRDTVIISGLFALILAMTGIYGLTVFSVEKRSQEVGVRRALGATDRNILGLFIKQSSRQLIMGLIVGGGISTLMLVASASVLALPTFVYAAIFVIILASLVSIVAVAVVIPARKAVMMQPSDALRYE